MEKMGKALQKKWLAGEIGALAESDHVCTDGETRHVHTPPMSPEKAELRVHGDVSLGKETEKADEWQTVKGLGHNWTYS